MHRIIVGAVIFGALAACSSSSSSPTDPPPSDPGASKFDPFDVPIDGVTREQERVFNDGDDLFDLVLRPADGLGPLYTRENCAGCHQEGVRGPGLVQKMSVVEADGITPAQDQKTKLPFGNTLHPLLVASTGAKTPIVAPAGDPSIKVTSRAGPAVLGRGYIEAILDSEIERVAREQAAAGGPIHGKVNRAVYASEENEDKTFHAHKKGDVVIGRFGLKARIATLDDFTADALQFDMGITSPLRPDEFPNPDGIADDAKKGIDASLAEVNKRANYLRLIAIPKRIGLTDEGRTLFAEAKCATCHVPSMRTRKDYPVPQLADIDAPVYSDLLLHDMGDALADGTAGMDAEATSRYWRSAPLIGLRFSKTFLHDGRAHSIAEAVAAHEGPGSEANDSALRFKALSPAQQKTLLDFVGAL